MPTLLREEGFRFYFYGHEPNEPPHVHVDKGGASAKVWLETVTLAGSIGYAAHDLGRILRIVRHHRDEFLETWHGYFGRSR